MERIAIIFVAAAVVFGAQAPQIVQRPGETAKPPAKAAAIEGTAVIRGNVTGPDGLPLRQAAVRIVGTRTGLSRGEPTDADGKYQAAGLPPDSYLVTASKAGYVTVEYGQRRASYPGKRVKVVDGDAQRIDFTLPRAATLTGRVVDEYQIPFRARPSPCSPHASRRGDARLQALRRASRRTTLAGFAWSASSRANTWSQGPRPPRDRTVFPAIRRLSFPACRAWGTLRF